MSNTCYLSLGTNIDNKLEHLNNAVLKIEQLGTILLKSSIYKSPSWGFKSDDFYNMSIAISTKIDAPTLLNHLQDIEIELGRIKNKYVTTYQARPIDIDILFFNNDIINTTNLTIPHPRIAERKFVLLPTIEIAPNYTHPSLKKTLEKIMTTCKDTSQLIKIS